jgi:hypothetical protein
MDYTKTTMQPQVNEIWRHYKTKGDYLIINLATMQVKVETLDMQPCVIHKALSDEKIWLRPLIDFIELVNGEEGGASWAL